MILVTGLPRSGTSLVTGVIRACGAWAGVTTGPSQWNTKGNVENEAIREQLVKPCLKRVPTCPLGLRSLPAVDLPPIWSGAQWRSSVEVLTRRQGYKAPAPLVYKDAKIALIWRQWAAAFPDAKWVIVERDLEAVVASAMRAEPMRRRFDGDLQAVRGWATSYRAHVDSIAAKYMHRVTPGDNLRPLIEWLGLQWNERAVTDWVDWSLYHGTR